MNNINFEPLKEPMLESLTFELSKTMFGSNETLGSVAKKYYLRGINDFISITTALYDSDTQFRQDNVKEKLELEKYKIIKLHYKKIKSEKSISQRGCYYWYAETWDGKIVSIGEEEGNYAGGRIATVEDKEHIKKVIDGCRKHYLANDGSYEASLYEKIKYLELADVFPDELR